MVNFRMAHEFQARYSLRFASKSCTIFYAGKTENDVTAMADTWHPLWWMELIAYTEALYSIGSWILFNRFLSIRYNNCVSLRKTTPKLQKKRQHWKTIAAFQYTKDYAEMRLLSFEISFYQHFYCFINFCNWLFQITIQERRPQLYLRYISRICCATIFSHPIVLTTLPFF